MNDIDKTQKIRFKFANGEEFEAEGSPDFVEKQRDYFLSLIKKKPLSASGPIHSFRPTLSPSETSRHEDSAVYGALAPRKYATAPGSYAIDNNTSANQSIIRQQTPIPDEKPTFSGPRLWEQLLIKDGEILYLRRKFHLAADDAALILLAGGKELLGKDDGCSALWLSRSMSKSGFEVERLDRLLAPALKLNFLLCQGAKRSRLYILTPAGFAHAFVLAEKKANSLL